MEKPSVVNLGGSVDKAITGQYQLDVKAILTEAWQKAKAERKAINLGLIFCFALTGLIMYLGASYLGIDNFEQVQQEYQLVNAIQLVATILVAPFIAGVEMIGVLNAVGVKTEAKLIFAFMRRSSWVALATLLSSVLISLGLQLLFLPGLFLLVALSLMLPLVVEKRLSPMQAIVVSVKALRFGWFKIFTLYAVLAAVLVLISLPMAVLGQSSLAVVGVCIFLFSISYLAPVYYYVKGILYREIFGVRLRAMSKQDLSLNDDIFSA